MNTAQVLSTNNTLTKDWTDVCSSSDLIDYSGISALVEGQQVAIFYVPDAEPALYALDNFCPAAKANVLARGMVGDINSELVVASPIYKEHYRLSTGQCIEKELSVAVWLIQLDDDRVLVKRSS